MPSLILSWMFFATLCGTELTPSSLCATCVVWMWDVITIYDGARKSGFFEREVICPKVGNDVASFHGVLGVMVLRGEIVT